MRNPITWYRLRKARFEGWTEPALGGNWQIANGDNVHYRGVAGIATRPENLIPARSLVKEARKRQRDLERGWLAGIEQHKAQMAKHDRQWPDCECRGSRGWDHKSGPQS